MPSLFLLVETEALNQLLNHVGIEGLYVIVGPVLHEASGLCRLGISNFIMSDVS